MGWGRKDRIAREAAEWVVLLDSPDFNTSDVARFKRWLAASEDHRKAFQLAQGAWTDLDQLEKLRDYPEIAALLMAPANDTPSAADKPILVRRALLLGAGAAGIAALVVGYSVLTPGAAEAFETGIGQQRQVTLADGTVAILNADTRIEARVSGGERRVRVVRGEVLFTIAQRSDSLSVSTAAGGIEAPDGEVLVKVLPDGARVSLMSGTARAWRAGLFSRGSAVSVGPQSEVEFGRGELHVAQADGPLLSRRTLWREGRLSFDDAPLSEAVEDVSRHTGVRFEFADRALADLRVGGVIDARDLNGFLLMLRENLAIHAERGADGVIILSSTATYPP